MTTDHEHEDLFLDGTCDPEVEAVTRCCLFTHIQKLRGGAQHIFLQEQVAATLLDPLNCIPVNQHDRAWALLRGMVITVIDKVKNSNASTDVNNSIEDVNDFLVTASAAAAVNSLDRDISSAEIADREIKIWQTRTALFPKDKNPRDEWRHGAVYLFPWLGVLVRRVLAVPATSTAPERLFSTAGNVTTFFFNLKVFIKE